jgi:hypothetical protein
MKSQRRFEGLYKGWLTFHTGEDQPDMEQNADSGSHHVLGTVSPGTLAHRQCHTSQTERSVMHPDRHDLEWHYCRGVWVG